jgi:hypothetical protein
MSRKTDHLTPYSASYNSTPHASSWWCTCLNIGKILISFLSTISGGRLLHPQPEDAPFRGDWDPYNIASCVHVLKVGTHYCASWLWIIHDDFILRIPKDYLYFVTLLWELFSASFVCRVHVQEFAEKPYWFCWLWQKEASRARCPAIKRWKVKLSLILTKHHAMKTYWRSGGIAPRILDLDTRWRWVDSFMPRPLYHQGKSHRYPLDRRLSGP